MRDDRFNSLKQEFSGVPDDAADALRQCQNLLERLFSYFPRENINQRDLMY